MSATLHQPDSVRSRYAVTLAAQIFRLLLSLISATIVPRTLGPAVYGNYSFLLSTAATLRSFVDAGAQQAFFTFSSQEKASGPLTKLYALVLASQFLIVMAIVGVAAATDTTEWLWHEQRLDQILLVTGLDWAMFLALSLQQLGDSKGLTACPQIIGASVAAVTIVGLLALWVSGSLGFYNFVGINLAGAMATAVLLGYWLLVRNHALLWNGQVEVRKYLRRWWSFAKPLLLLQFYLPLVAYLGIYLIQLWYGSVQQGYYALALQWSAFAMVFTNAAVWIFWREVAHHSAAKDLALAARTYQQFSRLFFFLVLVLACWLSMSSTSIIHLVAGDQYLAASSVLAIMAFYPVSQTLGQLTGASLKATERTLSFARWSVVLSVPDLLLTYLLLAPPTAPVPGLNLGAVGLAIKTALYGLVSVQFFDWLNCRYLGISYMVALRSRLAALLAVGIVAWALLNWGGTALQRMGLENVSALAATSCVYAIAIAAIVWARPQLAGLTHEQIRHGLRLLARR